jgi:hypothetical protein
MAPFTIQQELDLHGKWFQTSCTWYHFKPGNRFEKTSKNPTNIVVSRGTFFVISAFKLIHIRCESEHCEINGRIIEITDSKLLGKGFFARYECEEDAPQPTIVVENTYTLIREMS